MLDFSGYLENYLWSYYSKDVCIEHTLSIILMVNEKCKAGVLAFESLTKDGDRFTLLFQRIVDLLLNDELSLDFREPYMLFLVNTFRNVEDPVTRRSALRYLSLPIWESLSKTRLNIELENSAPLQKHWQKLQSQKLSFEHAADGSSATSSAVKAKAGKAQKKRKIDQVAVEPTATTVAAVDNSEELAQFRRDSQWIPRLLRLFLDALTVEVADPSTWRFVERFAEFLIDLLSQLPTRRFLKTLLADMHFVLVCRRSALASSGRPESKLFLQQVSVVDGYMHFEVDDQTGKALTAHDMMEAANSRIHLLQQVAYAHFSEELRDLVFSSVGELSRRECLLRHLELLPDDRLADLARRISVLTEKDSEVDGDFVRELLCEELVARDSQMEELAMMSLFPTEQLLWDEHQLPLSNTYTGEQVLSLPKLNLQFLTIHDYLLRNFTLFRLESAYEIRDDLTDAVKRMGPKEGFQGKVSFGGWARMALPVVSIGIDEVSKPRLGEVVPRHVDCSVTVSALCEVCGSVIKSC